MANNRKLGRPTDHRKAMLRALVTYLLENGQIKTTLTRAKEVAPVAEKMITLAKDNMRGWIRRILWLPVVRQWLTSPRKQLLLSCSLRSLRSTLTVTVATPAS